MPGLPAKRSGAFQETTTVQLDSIPKSVIGRPQDITVDPYHFIPSHNKVEISIPNIMV